MWVLRGCAAHVVTYKVCGVQVLSASHVVACTYQKEQGLGWQQDGVLAAVLEPSFHSPGHRLLLAR